MYKRFGVGDLNFFAGKHISQICYNWYVSDTLNHCAHFVSHVLGVSETNNCYNALGTPGRTMPGACIRVDELFNDWCQSRGRWHDKPVALHQCLFFISIPSNVTENPLRFGQLSTKHMGIFIDGMVWHYSNGRRKVVAQPLSQMDRHYAGLKPKDWLFYGTFGSWPVGRCSGVDSSVIGELNRLCGSATENS